MNEPMTGTPPPYLDDGFGNRWARCGPACELQIVRPGRVQCDRCAANEAVPDEDADEEGSA